MTETNQDQVNNLLRDVLKNLQDSLSEHSDYSRVFRKVESLIGRWARTFPDGVMALFDFDEKLEISRWYFCTYNKKILGQFKDTLFGFVGPSYSTGVRQFDIVKSGANSEFEKKICEHYSGEVITFSSASIQDTLQATDALESLLDVLSFRPALKTRTKRPFNEVRKGFDAAIEAGNRPEARRLRQELVDSGRVTGEQEVYLNIRLLAGLGDTNELIHRTDLIESAIRLKPPPKTLEDIITSLYRHFIEVQETQSSPQQIVDLFRSNIFDKYPGLFNETKGLKKPIVLRAFLLSEASNQTPDLSRVEHLYNLYESSLDGFNLVNQWKVLFSQLKESPFSPARRTSLVKIEEAQDSKNLLAQENDDMPGHIARARGDQNFERMSQIGMSLLPGVMGLELLIETAYISGEAQYISLALQAVNDASEGTVNNLKKRELNWLDRIRKDSNEDHDEPPGASQRWTEDWFGYINALGRGEVGLPDSETLENQASKWSIGDWLRNPDRCKSLGELLMYPEDTANCKEEHFLPILLDFFDTTPQIAKVLRPIYLGIVTRFCFQGMLSEDELYLQLEALRWLLKCGPQDREYEDALDAVAGTLEEHLAPAYIGWALATAELLIDYPANDGGARRQIIFSRLHSGIHSLINRIKSSELSVFLDLQTDYGFDNDRVLVDRLQQEMPKEKDELEQYHGKIALYSLEEQALKRAEKILKTKLPKAQIYINSDHTNTEKLSNLAKTVDIFVFAWKASKHQAYEAITKYIANDQLITPVGKGTSSMVEAAMSGVAASVMQ